MVVREEDKTFIANTYKYAFVGVMLDWINRDMLQDPKEIIAALDKVVRGGFRSALERFRVG